MPLDQVLEAMRRLLREGDRAPDASALVVECGSHVCNVMGARGLATAAVIVPASTAAEAKRLTKMGLVTSDGALFVGTFSMRRADALPAIVAAFVVALVVDVWKRPEDSPLKISFIKHAEGSIDF